MEGGHDWGVYIHNMQEEEEEEGGERDGYG